jgi:hypothetical protein
MMRMQTPPDLLQRRARQGAVLCMVLVFATCTDATSPSQRPEIEMIHMEPGAFTAASIGEVIEFTARALGRDGEPLSASLVWTSSDTTVLVRERDGRFRTRANGVAVVNVRPEGSTALTWPTATVVVHQVATRIELAAGLAALTGDTLNLFATGQTAGIQAKAFDALGVELTGAAAPGWSSANESIASVDEAGTVTARADGVTTLTLTAGQLTRSFVARVVSTFAISGCVTSAETTAAETCAGVQVSVRASR